MSTQSTDVADLKEKPAADIAASMRAHAIALHREADELEQLAAKLDGGAVTNGGAREARTWRPL